MTLAFYRAMLWAMEFEYAIGRSTGRNPADLITLKNDIAEMQRHVDNLEIQP